MISNGLAPSKNFGLAGLFSLTSLSLFNRTEKPMRRRKSIKAQSMKFSQLLLSLFVLPTIAYAGSWTSGGGELLRDARNPWFVHNTKQVTYCVAVEENTFGTSRVAAEAKVVEAIEFWKEEFKSGFSAATDQPPHLRLATQNFIQTDCSSNPDISFQLGVLSETQKKYIARPNDYVAVSVRTDYDSVHMKGRGFIYVAPSSGPLAFNLASKVGNPWEKLDGIYLYAALVHELGHVFGISHTGSAMNLMAEHFLEYLIGSSAEKPEHPLPKDQRNLLKYFRLPSASAHPTDGMACGLQMKELLLKGSAYDCAVIQFEHDPKNEVYGLTKMRVYGKMENSETLTLIGETVLNPTIHTDPKEFNMIWLPDNQKVYSRSQTQRIGVRDYVLGTMNVTAVKEGGFKLPGSTETRKIRVSFAQGTQTIILTGIIDNPDGYLPTLADFRL